MTATRKYVRLPSMTPGHFFLSQPNLILDYHPALPQWASRLPPWNRIYYHTYRL